jgi:hypothetical protein
MPSSNASGPADGIVRERYYPLDMQWLSNPSEAPALRIDLAKRRYRIRYAKVLGYRGEELFDTIAVSTAQTSLFGSIGGIEVVFSQGRVMTTLYIVD